MAERADPDLARRLHAFDVHPSGPLCGDGPSPARDEAAAVEHAALRGCEALMAGLAAARLEHARRALRVAAAGLTLDQVPGTGWWVAFRLPPGAHATMVLRELFDLRDASAPGC